MLPVDDFDIVARRVLVVIGEPIVAGGGNRGVGSFRYLNGLVYQPRIDQGIIRGQAHHEAGGEFPQSHEVLKEGAAFVPEALIGLYHR